MPLSRLAALALAWLPAAAAVAAGDAAASGNGLRVTASGTFVQLHSEDLRRPRAHGHKAAILAVEAAAGGEPEAVTLMRDGPVDVARPPATMSEVLKLEADVDECMVDMPVSVCWERFGSYGIRRLATQSWADIVYLGLARPDWMAHPAVQRKRLYELTLPGSHHSGAYQVPDSEAGQGPFGVITQTLNISQQLMLGIRAFDMRVVWSVKANALYLSHGYITVPLKHALQDMRQFLDRYPREIIIINARKDLEMTEASNLKPLVDEESDALRVPGQTVHEAVFAELESLLTTFSTLERLPANESLDNPLVSSLGDSGARALYFWEGQQVLCLGMESCHKTPGFARGPPGFGLPFGPPLPLGVRAGASGASGRSAVEPGCVLMTDSEAKEAHPEKAVRRLKAMAGQLQKGYARGRLPACFDGSGAVPPVHSPTLLYSLDAVVTPLETERAAQMQLLRNAKAVFSRGEGFSLRSEAERTNYLLLAWLLKQGYRPLFTQANVLSADFPSPILVHRIVEAMQDREDCGWALYCRVTGSCWAASLLQEASGACRQEAEVLAGLQQQAEGGLGPVLRVAAGGLAAASVALVFVALMATRKPAAAEGAAVDVALSAAPVAEAEASKLGSLPGPSAPAAAPSLRAAAASSPGATTPAAPAAPAAPAPKEPAHAGAAEF